LDLVFTKAIEMAVGRNLRYFNFGICNEDNGNILNDGLYRFKSEFGGAGVAHEFYEIST
jgi:lipid II:glycine glycyltransferase (peptidoglycan interpeptide bridge formation enzyme)